MTDATTGVRLISVPDAPPIAVPDAPPIAALTFRGYRGPADHPEMVRVSNAAREADHDFNSGSVEDMDIAYANMTNSDPGRDVLIAEIGGRLVAYSRVEWMDNNDGGRVYNSFGFVDPAWRRHGLGRAMLHHDERRLVGIAASHQTDRPRWLASWGSDQDAGNTTLLLGEGYVAARHFYEMVRPGLDAIEDAPLPAGLEVRPAREADLRTIFSADNEAFRDHWGSVDESDEGFRRWSGSPTFDASLLVVAWDGDQVAGAVVNEIDPALNARRGLQRGVLAQVFTRRPWRRRGLARALVARSLVLLRERGMTSAVLGVDTTNPQDAVHLYETAMFSVAESAAAYRKPLKSARGRVRSNRPDGPDAGRT